MTGKSADWRRDLVKYAFRSCADHERAELAKAPEEQFLDQTGSSETPMLRRSREEFPNRSLGTRF